MMNLFTHKVLSCAISDTRNYVISEELFDYIRSTLEPDCTILELGSGEGTEKLAKYYTMISIEHDKQWLNKYPTHYIYAPIKKYETYAWYDCDVLTNELNNCCHDYDLILIDGPTGVIGRYGFFHNMLLFNTDVVLIFDDVNRKAEKKLLEDVAKVLQRPYSIYHCKDKRAFGVIRRKKL